MRKGEKRSEKERKIRWWMCHKHSRLTIYLEKSSFYDSEQRTIIAADGFERYDDILTLGDSHIVNLAKGLSDRTFAAGKIRFGLYRTNILKANINWAQDFSSISWKPSIIGISNAAKFHAAIEAAKKRYRIRKYSLEELDRLRKAADPGKLKRHKDRITWSRSLKKYL